MSKNNKRQARRSTVVTAAGSSSSAAAGRTPERDFNPDYGPIIKDLRRIGILAGSFFTILVILAVFLR